jgi:hypothetical protein
LVGGGGGGAMVGVDHARALRPQAGLRVDEGLHAAERGGGLPPHQLTPDQRLQLHQPAQRAQRLPRLHCHVRQLHDNSVCNVISGFSHSPDSL